MSRQILAVPAIEHTTHIDVKGEENWITNMDNTLLLSITKRFQWQRLEIESTCLFLTAYDVGVKNSQNKLWRCRSAGIPIYACIFLFYHRFGPKAFEGRHIRITKPLSENVKGNQAKLKYSRFWVDNTFWPRL